jgi:hypothetical protein
LPEREVATRQHAAPMAEKDSSRHPVETVSWEDCEEFCRRLSALPAEREAGWTYRLPTEAQWEYACRAGTASRWFFGDDEAALPDYAWFRKNSGWRTHAVGEKKPNAWGLYDMCGNVCNWCADWSASHYYRQSPPSDPSGPATGADHVVRGGCFQQHALPMRSAYRSSDAGMSAAGLNRGFRVTADVPVSPSGKVGDRAAPSTGRQAAGRNGCQERTETANGGRCATACPHKRSRPLAVHTACWSSQLESLPASSAEAELVSQW